MEYTLWLLNSFAMENCQFGSMIKSDDVPIKNCGFPKLREITGGYVNKIPKFRLFKPIISYCFQLAFPAKKPVTLTAGRHWKGHPRPPRSRRLSAEQRRRRRRGRSQRPGAPWSKKLPSGKHTKNDGKIHHAIHGKIHYFYGDFQ